MDVIASGAWLGLAVLAIEAVVLARIGRLGRLWPMLCAGMALMLALGLSRVQPAAWPTLLALAAGGIAHAADLRRRS